MELKIGDKVLILKANMDINLIGKVKTVSSIVRVPGKPELIDIFVEDGKYSWRYTIGKSTENYEHWTYYFKLIESGFEKELADQIFNSLPKNL